MSIDDLRALALQIAVPPFSALLLYGSYARGDFQEQSDIDILQVSSSRVKSYSRGRVNVTCYTPGQLRQLATEGSLFALHLVTEAKALFDPDDLLGLLKREYAPPHDYSSLLSDVVASLPLVAIGKEEYEGNAHQYAAAASYLLRTWVYASAFSAGIESFSMADVSRGLGDTRPRERLADIRSDESFVRFRSIVTLLFELTGTQSFTRTESLEAFVVNSHGVCDLAAILGLRILARGELISYAIGGKIHERPTRNYR